MEAEGGCYLGPGSARRPRLIPGYDPHQEPGTREPSDEMELAGAFPGHLCGNYLAWPSSPECSLTHGRSEAPFIWPK